MNARQRLLSADAFGDRPCLYFDEQTFTYAEIYARAARYAAELSKQGIRAGDRVAVVSGSTPDLVVALAGHHHAGVVHVPINTRYQAAEVQHILTDCRPSLVLTDDAHAALVASAAPEMRVQKIGSASPLGTEGAPVSPAARIDGRDPALMIYTSGTTAKSKGVVLSYEAIVANMEALTSLWGWSAADELVLALPLFHVHGLCIGVYGSMLHGMPMRLLPAFDPTQVVEGVEAGGTIFMG
ncbi:MAG: class I adenylate-forming enzyme family protein, partial [Myxococcota bacterium]